VIDLSQYVFEALRKDDEFILYRGRSKDGGSKAAFASRLRQATARPDSSEMHSADCGHDEALAESGYSAPLILAEPNVSGCDPGSAGPSRALVVSPVTEYPAPEILKWQEHAYSLREELDPTWAARPMAIARYWDRPVLVLEDPSGLPLDQLLGEPREREPGLDLKFWLRIGISLASAIGQLHQRGVIHKDIRPANVLVNSRTGQCWLIGFGIASRLPRQRQYPDPPELIAGTLPYMAPEQTGRMNRSIDYRSDLYSLGTPFTKC
jgi:serine/threonine protein kinase